MTRRARYKSNRARVAERTRKQRRMRVELDFQLLCDDLAPAAPVVEGPPLRRGEQAYVTFAQLAGACATLGGRIEPHGEIARIEREGRGGDCIAPRPRAPSPHATTVQPRRHAIVSV